MTTRITRGRAAIAVGLAAMLALAGCTAPSVENGNATSAPAPSETPSEKTSSEVYPGGPFLDPRSEAVAAEEALLAAGETEKAEKMPAIIGQYVDEAEAAGTTLVFVAYAIPNRDCGGHSAGGLDYDEYGAWAQALAEQLDGTGAVMIVEPDSLAMLFSEKCAGEEARRLPLIKQAVESFTEAGLTSYLDAGNNNWIPEKRMAEMLTKAGVADVRGFFTNVSNFYRVDEEREYGEALSALIGGKRFVTDVSRNGNGWKGDWCNPSGAALGQPPVVTTSESTHLDALLWIKHPGVSDGACNGGPKAGQWWEQQALELVDNRPKKE